MAWFGSPPRPGSYREQIRTRLPGIQASLTRGTPPSTSPTMPGVGAAGYTRPGTMPGYPQGAGVGGYIRPGVIQQPTSDIGRYIRPGGQLPPGIGAIGGTWNGPPPVLTMNSTYQPTGVQLPGGGTDAGFDDLLMRLIATVRQRQQSGASR